MNYDDILPILKKVANKFEHTNLKYTVFKSDGFMVRDIIVSGRFKSNKLCFELSYGIPIKCCGFLIGITVGDINGNKIDELCNYSGSIENIEKMMENANNYKVKGEQ